MRKKLVTLALLVILALSACGKVKIIPPSNGCGVVACTTQPTPAGIYINP